MATKIGELDETTLEEIKETGYLIVSTGSKSYKLRVATIEPFSMTVDKSLDISSENPVQNSVVTNALNQKADKIGSAGSATRPVYFDADGKAVACGFSVELSSNTLWIKKEE